MLRPASEEEHGLERSARLRRRRVIRSGGLGAVVAGAVLALVPSAAATVPASQTVSGVEIARIVVATPVRARPTSRSSLRSFLSAVRPLTSQQTAVPVVRSAVDSHDAAWLMVRLPGRPIGRVGWIPASSAVVAPSPWRVVIDRKARRATLFRDGRVDSRFPVVVGAPWTPTPVGHYFVAEHVRQPIGSVLGPWALATSAYSHVLQEFHGGPGQIALHGRDGELLADPLGTAASHGCIRFDNEVIRQLSGLLPNGTPIDVV